VSEVVTGEAVVLEVPCARFPSRLLAIAIDLAIQVILLLVLFGILGATAAGGGLNPASAGALGVSVLVLVVVGYPVIWETLTRGRSVGKFALGLRVVSDDGGPERFRQALVRGLAAVIEIWALAGCPALICSLLSPRGKRLGDVFAGTFVIQQRLPARRSAAAPLMLPPELAGWAASLEMSGLTEQTAETARRFLARARELTPAARVELGERIAAAVRAQVSPPPPPGTPAHVFLAAVLAEQHNREQARLFAAAPRPGGAGGGAQQATAVPPSGWEPVTGPAAASAPGVEQEPRLHEPPAGRAGGFVPPA